uniref:DUF4216 domain-containing protein n=1 Tax=Fagus sylvatica TaxID=28930 RepID=A0A2N9HII4_FAGSY
MYLDGIETVHNRRERNEDFGECRKGLTVFTQTARPTGCRRIDGELSDELRDIAHWYLLYNTLELESYLEYMNSLRVNGSPEATNQLWALANGPNLLVKEYSAKQVFYLRDTKLGGHWQVVQCVQLRGVFDVPEVGDGESNDDTEANDAFQQETIAGVVPIEVANNDRYCRDDVEAEVIPTDETMAEHGGNNEDEKHDIPDIDMDYDM